MQGAVGKSKWALLSVSVKCIRQMDLEDFIGACLLHMLAYQRLLSILLFMKVLSKNSWNVRLLL